MQGGWYLQLRALVGIKVHSLRQQVRKERVELLAISMKIRREAPLPDMSLQVFVEDSGGIAPVSRCPNTCVKYAWFRSRCLWRCAGLVTIGPEVSCSPGYASARSSAASLARKSWWSLNAALIFPWRKTVGVLGVFFCRDGVPVLVQLPGIRLCSLVDIRYACAATPSKSPTQRSAEQADVSCHCCPQPRLATVV